MAVPNSPAGPRSVAAINPTRVGATFDDVANSPDGDFITAINPTSIAAKNVPAAGTVTFIAAASLLDNEYFTVPNATGGFVIFEFQVTAGFIPVAGRVTLDALTSVSPGSICVSAEVPMQNALPGISVARVGVTATMSLSMPVARGASGNIAITENVANAGFLVAGYSGGVGVTKIASPITQLPAASSKLVNWTPVVAAPRASAIVLPVAAQIAGILDANNQPVAGSGGPLYVQGNVTVGANQVGTSVILTPR